MTALAKPPHKLEILLIEDNFVDARLVSLALKGLEIEYELRVLSDGRSGMDFLQRKNSYVNAPKPDILFLDWKLPDKSGKEILREMRRDPALKDIPVAVLSGFNPEEISREVRDSGGDYLFRKPITLDRFPYVLQYLIDISKK
jgi:two-component system, chemotaxis family, response regulator Rcp1